MAFYQGMRVVFYEALAHILPEHLEDFELYLNRAAFHQVAELSKPHLIFHAYLD